MTAFESYYNLERRYLNRSFLDFKVGDVGFVVNGIFCRIGHIDVESHLSDSKVFQYHYIDGLSGTYKEDGTKSYESDGKDGIHLEFENAKCYYIQCTRKLYAEYEGMKKRTYVSKSRRLFVISDTVVADKAYLLWTKGEGNITLKVSDNKVTIGPHPQLEIHTKIGSNIPVTFSLAVPSENGYFKLE